MRFVTIVNPQSGPGYAPWWKPNEDYFREIPKLNKFKNVQTVGYLRADYCNRNVTDLERDITEYAARPSRDKKPELAMEGIFVDEVVNHYSDRALEYMDRVDGFARNVAGFRGDRIVSEHAL